MSIGTPLCLARLVARLRISRSLGRLPNILERQPAGDWNRTARARLFARAALSPSANLANAHESRHSGSLLRACTGSGSADLERRSSSRRLPVDHRSSVRVARTAPARIATARILVWLDPADACTYFAA